MKINWLLFRKTKLITVEVPIALYHALETATHMQNNARSEDDQIERDDIVVLALAQYMQKNLWTNVVEDFQVVTKLSAKEVPYKDQEKVRPIQSAQRK